MKSKVRCRENFVLNHRLTKKKNLLYYGLIGEKGTVIICQSFS
jgi:hypothetical protein